MPLKLKKRGGIWQITGTVNGERVRESTGTSDEGRAETIRKKREWELEECRVFGPKAVLTFGAAVNKYLDASGSTRFITPIFDRWKSKLVADIKPGDIRQLARDLYPNASVDTWKRQVIVPVRAVINHCADLGLCSPIRVKGFSTHEKKRQHDRIGKRHYRAQAATREWLDAFMANASPRLGTLALFMFTTSARISEATSLEWGDVDLQDNRALLRGTKNGEDGVAVLSQEMVVALANLERQGDKVFGFARRHSVYEGWKRTCKQAKIPYIRPHEAGRHAFATEMITRKGVDVETTARLGRWKSKRLLMETYVHGDTDDDVIEEVFGAKSGVK